MKKNDIELAILLIAIGWGLIFSILLAAIAPSIFSPNFKRAVYFDQASSVNPIAIFTLLGLIILIIKVLKRNGLIINSMADISVMF